MREPPATSTGRRWSRRSKRTRRDTLLPAETPQQGRDVEPPVLAAHREEGESLGAYETRYDIRHGYGRDRTIIRP